MPLEATTEKITLSSRGMGDNVQLLVEGDMIVPDINPDIYQVLKTDEKIFIDRIKVENGRVGFEGIIKAEVLYYGKKSGQPLSFMQSEFPIEDYIVIDGLTEDTDVDIYADIIHSDYRVMNDRKINVRFVCGIKAVWTNNNEIDTVVAVNGGEALQTKCGVLNVGKVKERIVDQFNVREELILPQGKAKIAEILNTEAEIYHRDIRVENGMLNLKGDLKIWVMYIGDEENYPVETAEFTVPFNGSIEMPNSLNTEVCLVKMTPASIRSEVTGDSQGEAGAIDTEVIVSTTMKVFDESQENILEDAYSLSKPVNISKVDTKCIDLLGKNRAQGMYRDALDIGKGQPEIMQILKVWGNIRKGKTNVEDGMVFVDGVADVKIMYIAKDDNMPINMIETSIPFSQEIEVKGANNDAFVDMVVEIEDISFSLISEKEVEIRLTISFDSVVCKNICCGIITGIDECEKECEVPLKGGAVIYTVKKGDSLWKIAKKYHTTVEDIFELNKNKIENPDLIYPGQKFLIIKKFV